MLEAMQAVIDSHYYALLLSVKVFQYLRLNPDELSVATTYFLTPILRRIHDTCIIDRLE